MKRFLALLILIVFLPVSGLAYSPGLGMSVQEFMDKYNAIPASLGSLYLPLSQPDEWVKSDGYQVAWFHAAQNSDVRIMLMSQDDEAGQSLQTGLDAVRIYNFRPLDFVSFISTAIRCTSLFALDVANTSTAYYHVAETIKYYYENVNDLFSSAVTTIYADAPVQLVFKQIGNESYFEIRNEQ